MVTTGNSVFGCGDGGGSGRDLGGEVGPGSSLVQDSLSTSSHAVLLLGQEFVNVVHVGRPPELVVAKFARGLLNVEDVVLRLVVVNHGRGDVFLQLLVGLVWLIRVRSASLSRRLEVHENVFNPLLVVVLGLGLRRVGILGLVGL